MYAHVIYSDDNKGLSDVNKGYSDDNVVYSDDKLVYGDDKVVYIDDKLVYSNDNVVYSDYMLVYGDEKVVYSDDKLVYSNNDAVSLQRYNLVKEQLPALLLPQVHHLHGHLPPAVALACDADYARRTLADPHKVLQRGAGVPGAHHHLERRLELLVGHPGGPGAGPGRGLGGGGGARHWGEASCGRPGGIPRGRGQRVGGHEAAGDRAAGAVGRREWRRAR